MVQDLNKHKVAKHFHKSINSYDTAAIIQQDIANQFILAIKEYSRHEVNRALEIGCGTGCLTVPLVENITIHDLFINDLVPEFEDVVKGKINRIQDINIHPCFGDIEEIEIPKELDLIVSSSTLQWLNDPCGFLNSLEKYINPNGVFALSLFTRGTLSELRSVIQVGLDYLSVEEVVSSISSKFEIVFSKATTMTSHHPNLLSLLQNLKATGVGGVREYRWTKGKLKNAETQYLEKFGFNGSLPVTYENYVVIGKRKNA